ncbi:MAG: hypothetical protein V1865_00105 [bacterium]
MPDKKEEKKKLKKEQSKKNEVAMQQVLGALYKYFFVITIMAVIIVFYLAYSYVLKPKYNEIYSGTELIAKQAEYLEKLDYFKEIIDLKTIYANISEQDKAKIGKIVSVKNSKEDLFREMESITDKNKIGNIRNKDEFFVGGISYTDKSFIDTLEVELLPGSELRNFAGSKKKGTLFNSIEIIRTSFDLKDVTYDDLMKILKIIEVNLRIMDVELVNYDPKENTAHLELLTYQLK